MYSDIQNMFSVDRVLDNIPLSTQVQVIRFSGREMTDEVTNELQLSGDLLSTLRELDRFIPTQLQTYPMSDSALHEQLVQDYPVIAIRELLLNAVLHRSYESNSPIRLYWFNNRIEIQNPGGLYGEATPENFPRQNAYRNPIIAEALKALGYVNRFGRGVYRAQKLLNDNGNPPPDFDFQPTFVSATIHKRS